MLSRLVVSPTLLVLLLAVVTGCARSRPVQPQATPAESPPVRTDPARAAPDARAAPAGEAPGRPGDTRANAAEAARAVIESRIYFDFDRSDLGAEARSALTEKLNVLLANPGMEIEIVGHADERGSDEYNLALGMARAAAAKRFLTQRGVASERISTSSMGEERPVCTESTESCWGQNRRDEFVITRTGAPRR